VLRRLFVEVIAEAGHSFLTDGTEML